MVNKKKVENIEPEIIEEIEVTSNRISLIDIIEDNYNNLEIKKYVPLEVKWQIIDDVITVTTDIDEQGMFEVNYKSEKLMFDITMLREYTNINLVDMGIQELYYGLTIPRDNFETGGIIDYVYNQINKEDIDYIKDCINKTIEQKKALTNSLEAVIDRGIKQFISVAEVLGEKAVERIPTAKETKSVLKDYGKVVSPEGAKMIKGMYEAFTNKSINIPVNTNTDVPKMTKADKDKLDKMAE